MDRRVDFCDLVQLSQDVIWFGVVVVVLVLGSPSQVAFMACSVLHFPAPQQYMTVEFNFVVC